MGEKERMGAVAEEIKLGREGEEWRLGGKTSNGGKKN